ncbi:MAG: hypothetical protein CK427_06170 [Leptospira sp.]|nr:MAG: hypothetical protein CK427_06170 [Leptospira sp.]
MMESRISLINFPNSINDPFLITSPTSPLYNCIAWAYGDNERWFWPQEQDAFWPENVTNSVKLDSFIELFVSIGYVQCDDSTLEEGYLKIAIYTNSNNLPTHAARQLENGEWTSKMGPWHDVSHSLNSMENGEYGNATVFMKKAIS